ncbi:DinB family protein [Hymenobacter convexus]|uniref:DinB family protein n=1 Tax=Hymenobacter sp. CA1UV-4 TaxID=3063782 RepID=UPI002712F244|nr:DinB family protein [Hymenobacter sp. CA1UV-4]MDO7854383.1 DinB family protein [Hymenobacter sp. CA1UV-4]
MDPAFSQQYDLVRGARAALLRYCATLSPAHFVAPVAAFNHSSIRDLLVHVAGCYQAWLGEVGLGRALLRPQPAQVPDVAAVRVLFADVDALVREFGQHFASQWLTPQRFDSPRHPAPLQLSPLQLFTHVITHEFHHKGQALSMSRQLGYVPVDTDVIRT